MNKELILVLCFLILITPSLGETQIIYENISTSFYKTYSITSDVCTTLHIECSHKWYINGSEYGSFPDGEFVPYPDGSEISIVLDDKVNTNLQDLPDSKSNYIIVIMTFLQPVLPWLVIGLFVYIVIKHETRKKRLKGR